MSQYCFCDYACVCRKIWVPNGTRIDLFKQSLEPPAEVGTAMGDQGGDRLVQDSNQQANAEHHHGECDHRIEISKHSTAPRKAKTIKRRTLLRTVSSFPS